MTQERLLLVLYCIFWLLRRWLSSSCRRNWELLYAEEDREIWCVWVIWGTYIFAYVVSVAMIFCKVAEKLTKDDDLGINALKATLCITPVLLILLLHLTICPSSKAGSITVHIRRVEYLRRY